QEKDIITDAYKIALAKQDIALGIIESTREVLIEESPKKYSKEKIADIVFQKVKEIPNKEITNYLKADKKDQVKIRLKIEKKILCWFKP
nr:hypothetical protein [Nanoarchaeota archaeon]